jgi:hypothetical protein
MVTLPRGIRNNNPLNIIEAGIKWQGMASAQPDDRFVSFNRPEDGIRAAAKILQAYQESHGINTLRGVINRWAPPIENDTSAYVTSVSIRSDIEPDDVLNLSDYKTVYMMLRAMTWQENGKPGNKDFWYPDDIWEKGLRMAGLVPDKPLIDSRTMKGTATAAAAGLSAVGILTDTFGIPADIASMLPTALSGMSEQAVAIVTILIGVAGSIYAAYSRNDDKLKGRL